MSGYTYFREYRVTAGNVADFLEHDRPCGAWTPLFRRGPHGRRG